MVGRCKSRQQGGFPHDIRGEPERRTAEFVEAVQVLLAEVHVDGTEVVAELFFGAGRDQRMTEPGCWRTQERATCAGEQPMSWEIATTSRTMSSLPTWV